MAGWPDEHFLSRPLETWEERWRCSSRAAFVEGVLRENTNSNGVFGTVVMWSYFDRMLQLFQEIPAYSNLKGGEVLAKVLHQPKYIWLRRRNRVEQAVSWAIACQTRVWTKKTGEKRQARAVPKFDFKVIDEWIKRIEMHEAGWSNYFCENHIEPLVLFYEDVVERDRDTAKHVLEFLGLPVTAATGAVSSTLKQANQMSEQWMAAYFKQKGKPPSYTASDRDV